MLSSEISARGVVHDLANYLLALELNLREEARENPSERVVTSIACLENAVGLLRQSYVRLKSEFQLPVGNFFDPIDVFKQVTKLHMYQLQEAGLKVLYSGRPVAIEGSKFGFQRVLTNLLLNTIEAHRRNLQGKSGTIYVIVRESASMIQLSIEDEAGGVVRKNRIEDRTPDNSAGDNQTIEHSLPNKYVDANPARGNSTANHQQWADTLMDSGYTTKGYGQHEGEHHGDGLKVVKEIISQEFGGRVSFTTTQKGIRVTLIIPS